MMTFSINIGTSTEAANYNIIGATGIDLSPILDILPDNTDKEINPKDIRDAVLTSWSSSAFNQTMASQSSISYIGIDNGNTIFSDKDIKSKIYLGKRYFGSTDIMTTDLLNSETDLFFYNTKKDTVSNSRTRIAILSGTASYQYTTAPYIQSQLVTVGTNSTLSLDIVNPTLFGGSSSAFNITSSNGTSSTSTVSLNEIPFPRTQESLGLDIGLTAAGDGRVLSWDNGKLIWSDLTFDANNYIGVTGSPINIYGGPVNVNGYAFEFTDSRPCPVNFGDIQMGETFSSVSIVEMLRRMVYDYLPPLCSIEVLPPYSSGYVEVGSSPLIKLGYTITKRTLPTQTTILSYMIPGSYPAITTSGYTTISGSSSGVIISPVTSTTASFSITVNDGNQSNVASTNVVGVYPYFYGFSSLSVITTVGLSSLTKIIEPKNNKTLEITGSGNLYFIYDSNYPALSNIYDELGNTISSSFSTSTLTISSPTGLWASKQFRVYQYNGVSQIGPSVNYQFKY